MKKLIIFSVISIFLLANIVYAQQEISRPVPGDALFFVKKAFENIQLAFTKGAENKARLRIRFVDRRLLEVEYIAKTNSENINKALAELQKETDGIKTMQLPKNTKDVAVDYVEDISLTKLIKIRTRFENDNNTNNDHAINGLGIAIAQHSKAYEDNMANVGDFKKDDIKIYIKTNGIATISAVINGKKTEYQAEIGTGDSDTALSDLSSKVGISVSELKKKAQISITRQG